VHVGLYGSAALAEFHILANPSSAHQGALGRPPAPDEVCPVRVRDDGVALESSFEGGAKREVLRALCQVRPLTAQAARLDLWTVSKGGSRGLAPQRWK